MGNKKAGFQYFLSKTSFHSIVLYCLNIFINISLYPRIDSRLLLCRDLLPHVLKRTVKQFYSVTVFIKWYTDTFVINSSAYYEAI